MITRRNAKKTVVSFIAATVALSAFACGGGGGTSGPGPGATPPPTPSDKAGWPMHTSVGNTLEEAYRLADAQTKPLVSSIGKKLGKVVRLSEEKVFTDQISNNVADALLRNVQDVTFAKALEAILVMFETQDPYRYEDVVAPGVRLDPYMPHYFGMAIDKARATADLDLILSTHAACRPAWEAKMAAAESEITHWHYACPSIMDKAMWLTAVTENYGGKEENGPLALIKFALESKTDSGFPQAVLSLMENALVGDNSLVPGFDKAAVEKLVWPAVSRLAEVWGRSHSDSGPGYVGGVFADPSLLIRHDVLDFISKLERQQIFEGQVGDWVLKDLNCHEYRSDREACFTANTRLGSVKSLALIKNERGCAVTTSGALKCWATGYGDTSLGKSVDVEIYDFLKPENKPLLGIAKTVTGFESGVSVLALADTAGCVIKDARLHCWGSGGEAPKDWSKPSTPLVPTLVEAVKDVPMADVKFFNHVVKKRACSLSAAGRPYCWGNVSGMTTALGMDGQPMISSPLPVEVAPLSGTVTSFKFSATGLLCVTKDDGSESCIGQPPT